MTTAPDPNAGELRRVLDCFRRDHPGDDRTDPEILRSLAEHLVERGVMEVRGGIYVLVGSTREANAS